MRKIGYARVSTSTQNLDRQMGALRTERCDEVYREKASGKAVKGRPQLEKAIDALGRGDVLVVAEWDRATTGCHDQGARQAPLGPHHAYRARFHRVPERPGGGRAPADREACQ